MLILSRVICYVVTSQGPVDSVLEAKTLRG